MQGEAFMTDMAESSSAAVDRKVLRRFGRNILLGIFFTVLAFGFYVAIIIKIGSVGF